MYDVALVNVGVAAVAVSTPDVADVELVNAGVAAVAVSTPDVADVELVSAGVATFAASNSEVAEMEFVEVGFVNATEEAEITGTADSSNHPVPPALVTSPILYSNKSNLVFA